MRIRNVCTYGHHHIYIYIVRLIIEHHREWLASLTDKCKKVFVFVSVHVCSQFIFRNEVVHSLTTISLAL